MLKALDPPVAGVGGAGVPLAEAAVSLEAGRTGPADGTVGGVAAVHLGEAGRRVVRALRPLDPAGLALLQGLAQHRGLLPVLIEKKNRK